MHLVDVGGEGGARCPGGGFIGEAGGIGSFGVTGDQQRESLPFSRFSGSSCRLLVLPSPDINPLPRHGL